MAKYVKKPVVIEAVTYEELIKNEHGKPIELEYNGYIIKRYDDDRYIIPTLEGNMLLGKDGIVHKDGYRVQLVVEDVGMSFAEAFKRMKAGRKVKLPSWGGFWYWDTKKETIMMQCRDKDNGEKGDLLDIRDTKMVEYTLNNILSNEWIIAE